MPARNRSRSLSNQVRSNGAGAGSTWSPRHKRYDFYLERVAANIFLVRDRDLVIVAEGFEEGS
jgi:hypothetical protein